MERKRPFIRPSPLTTGMWIFLPGGGAGPGRGHSFSCPSGSRRELLEAYIKRLEKLEEIANSYEGVAKAYALQAGREIRIIVESQKISDDKAALAAKEIAQRIKEESRLSRKDQGDCYQRDEGCRVCPIRSRVLFIGDIIGRPGRRALEQHLSSFVRKVQPVSHHRKRRECSWRDWDNGKDRSRALRGRVDVLTSGKSHLG